MIRALAVRVVLTCVAGGVVLVSASVLATPALVRAPAEIAPPAATDVRSAGDADRVATLLAEHRCWVGEAPAGAPEPGHAVVTLAGATPRRVEASVGYGIWLEDEPGVLHGFCP